jgi:hypothetical protein
MRPLLRHLCKHFPTTTNPHAIEEHCFLRGPCQDVMTTGASSQYKVHIIKLYLFASQNFTLSVSPPRREGTTWLSSTPENIFCFLPFTCSISRYPIYFHFSLSHTLFPPLPHRLGTYHNGKVRLELNVSALNSPTPHRMSRANRLVSAAR